MFLPFEIWGSPLLVVYYGTPAKGRRLPLEVFSNSIKIWRYQPLVPPTHILYIALYDDWTMNFDDGSSNHRHEFFPYMTIVTLWIMLCRCSTNILSHLNSCRIHLSSHRHNPCTKQLMFWIDSLFCSEIVNSLAKRFWRHSFPTHLSSQNLECVPFPTFHSIPLSNQPLLSPPHSQIPPPYWLVSVSPRLI